MVVVAHSCFTRCADTNPLAAVYLNGFKDQVKAKKALTAALKIKADLTLPDAVATPELRALLAQMQGKPVEAAPSGSAKPSPPVACC